MRLIVLLGVLAVALADHQQPYYGPQHIPVIQNGVPVEPQAVQAARAAHLSALGGNAGAHAAPYQGPGQWNGNDNYNNPAPQQGRWTPPAYQTSSQVPKIGQDGQPLDTPEVQAAKANHFAAYGQQHAALGQAFSLAQPSGGGHYGGGHYRKRRSIYGGYGGYGYAHAVPQIGPNGVPLDTPDVQHAKAAHFSAVAEATARAGAAGNYGGDGGYDDGSYDGRYDGGAYDGRYDGGAYDGGAYDGGNAGGYAAWNGPIHIPVIGPNGVPVDTPAVQQARAAHLSALHGAGASAGHGYGYGGYGHGGYGHY